MERLVNKTNILNYLKEHSFEFKEKYNVKKIGLFGSYARECENKDSDIDIFVEMEPKFDNYMALKFDIENSLQKKVDLIAKHKNIKPLLLQMIQKDIIYV